VAPAGDGADVALGAGGCYAGVPHRRQDDGERAEAIAKEFKTTA
jgi:hypothetical protein